MIFPVVCELAADGVPVAVTCRVLKRVDLALLRVAHPTQQRPGLKRQAHLMETIRQVHAASHGAYGHRRVHAELVLGHGMHVWHGRVARLMRHSGLPVSTGGGCTRRDQAATPSNDLVERNFAPEAPERLYVADVT